MSPTNQEAVLDALRSLVTNWYTVEAIGDVAKISVDDTSDALVDLEISRKVEIDVWEDGPRIRLLKQEEPLNEEQKALVERFIPMARKIALERSHGKYLANEELVQHLCVELIDIVKRYRSEEGVKFSTYAFKSLTLAKIQFYREQSHLRGFKQGKEYDDKPVVADLDWGNPDAVSDLEEATAYYDTPSMELRENVELMLKDLPRDQMDALVLTEVYSMTGQEAATVSHTSRNKINKAKQTALQTLKENFDVSPEGEVYDRRRISSGPFRKTRQYEVQTEVPAGPILPRLLLGLGVNWPGPDMRTKKEKKKTPKACPVCQHREIPENAYCLFCDSWGQDEKFKLMPQERDLKTVTVAMTKARDLYRQKSA
jgi:RNA polymerase sigma factor (sigma-70 family)